MLNKVSSPPIIPSSITHFAAADHKLGYGIGKIVREAFEYLFFPQDKINLSTEDIVQIKPTIPENDLQTQMKRTMQQTGGSPASFNLNSLNGANGFSVYGLHSNDELGNSVSPAGDLNGDGITDLVLGAYQTSPSGLANAGAVYVLFGSKTSWPTSFNLDSLSGTNGFSVHGSASADLLGSSVSSPGDLNGDGITDLVLGADGALSYAGATYILFGNKSRWPASFNLTSLNGTNGFSVYGPAVDDALGASVSSAGDLNGDGISDLVLGAPGAGWPNTPGAAYVLFGSNASWPASFNLTFLNGTNGFSVYGLDSHGQLGNSVSSAGDLNGDGITDLVLGDAGALSENGAAYILFGSKANWPTSFNLTSLNGTNGFSIYGAASYDSLGSSVNSIGDLNGDGITDLVLGAPNASPGGLTAAGAAYVLFGSKNSWPASFNLNSLNGTNGFSVYGAASGEELGFSVSSAGDLNGDGISDLVLGAPNAFPGGLNQAGAAYVLFGSKTNWPASFNLTSLNGPNGFTVYGPASGDELGVPVSSAGDLNGDGIMDLVLGAPNASPVRLFNLAGSAYVIFGSRKPFISSPFTVPSMIATSILTPIPTKTFIPSSALSTVPSTSIPTFSPQNEPSTHSSTNNTETIGIAVGVFGALLLIGALVTVVFLKVKKRGCFADNNGSQTHPRNDSFRRVELKAFS